MGYLTNFIVYTLAMVGVMVIALFVFKNATGSSIKGGTKFLKVIDTLSLGPRKTLYIVSAGEEKFLIAGDVDKTSLISKLNPQKPQEERITTSVPVNNFQETIKALNSRTNYMDRSVSGIHKTQNIPYGSVMKNLAQKISAGVGGDE